MNVWWVKYLSIAEGQVTFLVYLVWFNVEGDHAMLIKHVKFFDAASVPEIMMVYFELLMLQAAMGQWYSM
jgi:hypothetical protein